MNHFSFPGGQATEISLENNDRLLVRRPPYLRYAAMTAAAVMFVLLAVALYGWLSDRHLAVPRDEVTLAEARRGMFTPSVSAPATVEAVHSTEIAAAEGGAVIQLLHREGDVVRAGDPILQLANPELERAVAQAHGKFLDDMNGIMAAEDQAADRQQSAQASVNDNERQYYVAEREYSRQKVLGEKGILSGARIKALEDDVRFSQQKMDLARSGFASVERRAARRERQIALMRNEAEATLALQRGRLDRLTIRAPMSGVLSALRVELGAAVGANQSVGRVDDDRTLRLVARVPAAFQAEVRQGQFASLEGVEQVQARVTTVDRTVRNDEIRVVLEIQGAGVRALRVGQTLTVRISSGARRAAVTVGYGELVGPGYAYVVTGSGDSARRRPVRLGQRNGNEVEVLEGIAPGDKVVTSTSRPVEDATLLDFEP